MLAIDWPIPFAAVSKECQVGLWRFCSLSQDANDQSLFWLRFSGRPTEWMVSVARTHVYCLVRNKPTSLGCEPKYSNHSMYRLRLGWEIYTLELERKNYVTDVVCLNFSDILNLQLFCWSAHFIGIRASVLIAYHIAPSYLDKIWRLVFLLRFLVYC